MKKSDLVKSHKPLDDDLERYKSFAVKVLAAKRVLGNAEEKRDLMESTLLRTCARWEMFVEQHLVKCVNRHPEQLAAYLSADLPAHPSKQLCRALLFGRKYADFRSSDELVGEARKMLPKDTSPFDKITKRQRELIDESYTIRNYLSHYSDHAKKRLKKMYQKSYEMKTFREPGGFLAADSGKRMLFYIKAFQDASQSMQK